MKPDLLYLKLTLQYFGDDKYANKTVQTRFVVSKVDTPMKITVVNDTSIYVNDTVKVVVTVPSDVTENVTIEINGMKFTNATNSLTQL